MARIITQRKVLRLLKKIRYRLRIGVKGKRNIPFIYRVGSDVPSTAMQVRESLFYKLRTKGKIELFKQVRTTTHCYDEYTIFRKEKKPKRTRKEVKRVKAKPVVKKKTYKIKRKNKGNRTGAKRALLRSKS